MYQDNRNFDPAINRLWLIREWRHASSILKSDFPEEWADLLVLMKQFELKESFIRAGGGGKSKISIAVERILESRGWTERRFQTSIKVDDEVYPSPTHTIDGFKNRVGIEIEWNNKDPFFDRDLNNFRLLHQLDILSVGIVITRDTDLQGALNEIRPGTAFGRSSTHTDKLWPKIDGGGAGGCPILVLGITESLLKRGE